MSLDIYVERIKFDTLQSQLVTYRISLFFRARSRSDNNKNVPLHLSFLILYMSVVAAQSYKCQRCMAV